MPPTQSAKFFWSKMVRCRHASACGRSGLVSGDAYYIGESRKPMVSLSGSCIDDNNQGFTNAHHRDTERTENAQRKKTKIKGWARTHVIGWNYRYDDYKAVFERPSKSAQKKFRVNFKS